MRLLVLIVMLLPNRTEAFDVPLEIRLAKEQACAVWALVVVVLVFFCHYYCLVDV